MNWRFSLFLIFIFFLLIYFSLAPWEESLCRNPVLTDLLGRKDKDGAIGCFEFWFNRYQTLVGTIAAVGAAAAAWLASQGQISAAKHQANIGQQQYAAAALPVLEKLLANMNETDASFRRLSSSLWSIIRITSMTKSQLADAYQADGNAMGTNFTNKIIAAYRSGDSFEKADAKFEEILRDTIDTGSRLIVNTDVLREHIHACDKIGHLKTDHVHYFIDFENLYRDLQDGDTETAEVRWREIEETDFGPKNICLDRPRLKQAQEQIAAKIESITNALVS